MASSRPMRKALLFIFFMAAFLTVGQAYAASPSIVNIGVGQSGNLLTVDAKLTNGFNHDLMEVVESGVPVNFTYQIELRRSTPFWKDSLIASAEVVQSVQYDSLQKTFRFLVTGKNVKRKLSTHDKARFQELLTTLKDVPIASFFKLDPEAKYYVRVKADLKTDRFWFPFNHLLFFVPFNDIKTSWAESSPLQLPAYAESEEASLDSKTESGAGPKVLKHVIRSFNQ